MLDPPLADVVARLAPGCLIGGRAAARLYEQRVAADGLTVFHPRSWRWGTGEGSAAGPGEILVCAPTRARVRVTGSARVLRGALPAEDRSVVAGVPVTSPDRTAFDLARLCSATAAVVAVDRLLRLGLVEREDVRRLALARPGWRGRPAALHVLDRAEVGVARPEESVLRMIWLDAGLPRPRCHGLVTARDRPVVVRADLVDPDAGVVGLYDRTVTHRRALESLGLVVVPVRRVDLWSPRSVEVLQARLRRAYRHARSRGVRPRPWDVEP